MVQIKNSFYKNVVNQAVLLLIFIICQFSIHAQESGISQLTFLQLKEKGAFFLTKF